MADLAESWGARGVDCPDGACLLVEYWCAGGDGFVRSGFKMEEACGVMDCSDMDLFTNESVYDSIGAMDHFTHGGVIDLWNDTTRLG